MVLRQEMGFVLGFQEWEELKSKIEKLNMKGYTLMDWGRSEYISNIINV